ncbi:MAG: gamma-glutamyl-gamma-aminobutyrate hydrolase family protein [Bacteroidales bacterium]|nr:gamma-glutamyl-gamma-aminobutyrate hydrolase family protein [Bacteroidales bacterium]
MKTKPVIGVLPLWDVDRTSLWMLTNYLDALRAAGGTPIVLTFDLDSQEIARMAAMCDGLLFTGGQDVHPSVYGEEDRTGRLIPCPKRDQLEVRVLQAALEADKPIFGICRGIQLINAALGGTLYQDLPTEHPSSIVHRQGKPYDVPSHPVKLSGPLAALLNKETIVVNTLHHQAVKTLAPGLEPMAYSPDGLVEAFCKPDCRFLWAVQWHPEYLFEKDPDSLMLFRHFLRQCSPAPLCI